MRDKLFIRRIGMFMLAVMLMVQAALFMPTEVKADNNSANRMNVVFVMDGSGSMKQTDTESLRYEAVELFTALAADSGNYMGAVVFDDDIMQKIDIAEMQSKSGKEALTNAVRAAGISGDTDIGKALATATDMLKSGANRSYQSVIILLSDGNTDLDGNPGVISKEEEESQRKKSDAVADARAQGIKVYSICLNSNGTADPDELRQISEATGGQFREVQNAKDLMEVYKMFYGLIFGGTGREEGNYNVPCEVSFTIPALGVEEANIVIGTDSSKSKIKANLQEPGSNDLYSDSEMATMTTSSNSFMVIKIINPVPGEWTLHLSGDDNATVNVSWIYNHDLSLDLKEGSNGNAKAGQPITLTATVKDKGSVVTDMAQLNNSPVHLSIKGTNTGISEDVIMDGSGITYDFIPTLPDEYQLMAYIDVDSFHEESNIITISIVNEAPEATDFTIKKVVTPFSKPEKISLSMHAKDPDGSELTFTIEGSTLKADSYSLRDDQLEIEVAKSGSGDIKLLATDVAGDNVSFTCTVKVFNVFILIIALLAAAIVAVVVAILVRRIKMTTGVIQGNIRVIPFSQGMTSMQEVIDGDKGQMILGRYLSSQVNTGINYFQCYFQAGERPNFIYFVSKQGYTTDFNPDVPSKRIRLDDQLEVTIYGSEDHSCGIRVTYTGYNDMYGF